MFLLTGFIIDSNFFMFISDNSLAVLAFLNKFSATMSVVSSLVLKLNKHEIKTLKGFLSSLETLSMRLLLYFLISFFIKFITVIISFWFVIFVPFFVCR